MNKLQLNTIVQAMQTMPYSVSICGHFLAVIKPKLMKIGFRSFPALVFCSPPGSGKTAMYFASLYEDSQMVNFWENFGELKEIVNDPNAFTNLDDIADVKSQSQKEKRGRVADEIVRKCFAGEGCVLGMTIEEKALKYLPDSCVDRMLTINVKRYWTASNKRLQKELIGCRKTMKELVRQFKKWFAGQNIDFASLLEAFEHKHAEELNESSRTVYIVFAVMVTMKLFYQFIREVHNETYVEFCGDILVKLDVLEKELFKARSAEAKSYRAELFERILKEILTGQDLAIQKPELRFERCIHYLRGTCSECNPFFHGFDISNCSKQHSYQEANGYYEYRELVLAPQYNCVFLSDIGRVVNFSDVLRNLGEHPVLIISKSLLVQLINEALMRLNAKEKVKEDTFTSEEVTTYLYRFGMVLYTHTSGDKRGRRYSMTYYCVSDEIGEEGTTKPFSALLLRLTQAQTELLDKNSSVYRALPFYQMYAEDLYKAVKGRWPNLRLSGAVGEYSNR